jgi:hypothetical protein
MIAVGGAVAMGTPGASAAPMVVLYGSPESNRAIVGPGRADRLPVDGRLFIQEPNPGHLFAGDADRPYRLARVTEDQLTTARTAPRMAALLKRSIDQTDCRYFGYLHGCQSHLVFVDEIDVRFAEKAPNLNTPAWRGRTSRSQPKRKFPNYIPRPRRGQLGFELGRAMQRLAATPWRGGGTYADRVHFYISPALVGSIGSGRGRYFNLGRDRRPHFRSYEGVRPALQLAGGVWLEMYHFSRATGRYPSSSAEWAAYPWKFARYLTAPGAAQPDPARQARIHFLMTRGMPRSGPSAPAECRNPATPQGCQFALASSPRNAPILANGVGAFKMDGDEGEWRALVRQNFLR